MDVMIESERGEAAGGGGGEMELLHHFSHHHPSPFFSYKSFTDAVCFCRVCGLILEDDDDDGVSIYWCNECKYYLHKECAKLDLALQIDHPFHPKHPLTLLPNSPDKDSGYVCLFCNGYCLGFVYHCDSCDLYLHLKCASLLQSSIAPNSPNSLHHHSLILVQNHDSQVKKDCNGCKKPLCGPIYHCSECSLNLHKECAELPLEINHPYDRNHPLTLVLDPPSHPCDCSCYLCKIGWGAYVYSCSLCNFEFRPEDVLAPRTITDASHQHPWTLISRQMSFACDFCGTSGDHNPYFCATCDLLVHKDCITLPRRIMITRHHHIISHSYSLPRNQVEDWICRICYREVDKRYGCFYCARSNCNYIAHVHCATHKTIWDGTPIPEDCDESSMEPDSSNLITHIFQEMLIEEQMVASEIKHAYHDHNLRLVFSSETRDDDSQCDGCMRPVSTPFYTCEQCSFFLHKDCAELPREKRHPFHNHLLKLTDSHGWDGMSRCSVCTNLFHGYSYRCYHEDCRSHFQCDIRCILLSDTLMHPSHEHLLFLVNESQTKCSGCPKDFSPRDMAYKCTKHCDFILDLKCATLPLTAQFKYDRHPLTLTYSDDSGPSQHYCDLCENERDPKDWFYYCDECDNSLHFKCALGSLQFLKIGSRFKDSAHLWYWQHLHQFAVVKNIWNCPNCKVCDTICSGLALECKEPQCNFTVHYGCLYLPNC